VFEKQINERNFVSIDAQVLNCSAKSHLLKCLNETLIKLFRASHQWCLRLLYGQWPCSVVITCWVVPLSLSWLSLQTCNFLCTSSYPINEESFRWARLNLWNNPWFSTAKLGSVHVWLTRDFDSSCSAQILCCLLKTWLSSGVCFQKKSTVGPPCCWFCDKSRSV